MKYAVIAMVFMLCLHARPVAAFEHVGCHSLDNNSCWHAVNHGVRPVSVRCDGYGRDQLFAVHALTHKQVYSYQYSQGWADGLGYFEPNVTVRCRVRCRDGRSAVLNFCLRGYGDRVAIEADDEAVSIVVRAFWSSDVHSLHAPLS
ncbi:MAG: hypothetical protein EOO40_10615 [Deltaproteobacteria bacterium]|nr:MAG: hypothetical protein EOO40_10615 [Deltaproteobacteria bacterium]